MEKERRQFFRLDYAKPLALKICKPETIEKILKGYTSNISQAGLQCDIKEKVHKNDVLWISFDRSVLTICQELESRSLIYQGGIVGKVMWVEEKHPDLFSIGIRFFTREEQDIDNLHLIRMHITGSEQE